MLTLMARGNIRLHLQYIPDNQHGGPKHFLLLFFRQIECCETADEFYSTMGRLTQEMLENDLLESHELMQVSGHHGPTSGNSGKYVWSALRFSFSLDQESTCNLIRI